ncbi:hypothetical protein, partial [Phytoactinopolyspora endophytica]|uniref:hypothetical protein n=1 Tax=Phytoactinopolyspora endophytica TaxID=1642495 RepID=UPI00197BD07B
MSITSRVLRRIMKGPDDARRGPAAGGSRHGQASPSNGTGAAAAVRAPVRRLRTVGVAVALALVVAA